MKLYNIRKYILLFTIVALQIIVYSCANVGYPSGGEVDKIPPKVLAFIPLNETNNFGSDKVIIQFDEYIQLKDVDNQVLISPPFENKPEIVAKGKAVHITIKDTLRPNTTYLFQFKNAVVDNNEGNPLPSLNYVFSTGNVLDSLSVKGKVSDAFTHKADEEIYVLLYSDFADSVVSGGRPVYITKTDKEGNFEFNYISEGSYKVIALKDDDKSLTYSNVSEKIGFVDDTIRPRYVVDSCDTVVDIVLHTFVQESAKQRITSSKLVKSGKAVLTAQCPLVNPIISSEAEIITSINSSRDTLQIWAMEEVDSLSLIISDVSGLNDTLKLRYFKKRGRQSRETFMKTNIKSTFPYYDSIRIRFTNPIDSVLRPSELVYIKTATDSFFTSLCFDSVMLNATVAVNLVPDTSYSIIIPGNTLVDIYGNKNDTLILKTKVNKPSDYGAIKINLKMADDSTQYIVQILSDKDKVVAESVGVMGLHVFPDLVAGTYKVRVIADSNGNTKWDAGNYWQGKQSEPVYYLPKAIELRSNWDIEETFSPAE